MPKRRGRRTDENRVDQTWNRFTERARRSVGLAHEEAERLGQEAVSPELLVLGMLRVPESVGARALAALGVTLDAASEDLAGGLRAAGQPRRPRMAPETKWTLQLAVKEARQLDADYIGTEHILLALSHLPVICGGQPGGARLLPGLGLTMGQVRKAVLGMIVGSRSEGDAGPDPRLITQQILDVFAENERLRTEVARLRSTIDERGDPRGGTSESA